MGLFGGSSKIVETEAEEPMETAAELPEPRTSTVIAQDVEIEGSIHGDGVVQIEGTVTGEITLKGYVIVSPTGRVRGPIEADVIRVAGWVEGNISSRDHVQLERTGQICGDVTTLSFVIEDGGRLNGRTTMAQPRPESGAAAAAAPAPAAEAEADV